jgi:hypothetical protein
MSAVIWCGIVAVWVFVLIPTWVRRGDIHWHRGTAGAAAGSVSAGSASASESRSRRLHLPGMRFARSSRADESDRAGESDAEGSNEVEAMSEYDAEPETYEPMPAPTRARVAASARSQRFGHVMRESFGTAGSAARGAGRPKPPIRVRRARRLVALAVLALVSLIAAIVAGGLLIALNLICDIALFLYVRHLRSVARSQRAQLARERRARAARQAWDQASASERASQLDGWRMPATQPMNAEPAGSYDAAATAAEPEQIDLTTYEDQPAQPVATSTGNISDAPTEELIAARAS